MKDVHPDSDTETEELKDLNKDILRRYEQLKQVWQFTVWNFQKFPATQIFREINFRDFRGAQ